MQPNDVDLVRTYAREVGTLTEDVTLETGKPFELSVEAEVGTTLFGTGGSFELYILIRDISDNSKVIHTDKLVDNFGNAWANFKESFVFNVPAAVIAGRENHILEAHAVLSAGGVGPVNPPDVSFVRSRLFTASAP